MEGGKLGIRRNRDEILKRLKKMKNIKVIGLDRKDVKFPKKEDRAWRKYPEGDVCWAHYVKSQVGCENCGLRRITGRMEKVFALIISEKYVVELKDLAIASFRRREGLNR